MNLRDVFSGGVAPEIQSAMTDHARLNLGIVNIAGITPIRHPRSGDYDGFCPLPTTLKP